MMGVLMKIFDQFMTEISTMSISEVVSIVDTAIGKSSIVVESSTNGSSIVPVVQIVDIDHTDIHFNIIL
jgi:hypothetical protein